MSVTRITTRTTTTVWSDAEPTTDSTTTSTTTVVQLFTFDELDEDVQNSIVGAMRDDASQYLEADDLDDVIREAWAYALAEDGGGEGSRPDLEAMVTGWDLDRGWSLEVRGTLTPGNAPKLPWPTMAEGDDRDVYVDLDPRSYVGPLFVPAEDDAHAEALVQAVRDAMHTALEAGRGQVEYLTGEECARERVADDVDQLWTAEGVRA